MAAQREVPASHFNVFPTLLMAMGYDRDEVIEKYGADLTDLDAAADAGSYSGSVFGYGAKWNKATPLVLTSPPAEADQTARN